MQEILNVPADQRAEIKPFAEKYGTQYVKPKLQKQKLAQRIHDN
jgi:hypothetical protein